MATTRPPLPRTAVAAAATAALTTVSTFLPWATSGSRVRSSYEVIDVAGRAGVLSDSTEVLAGLWYLLPVSCGVLFVGVALRSVLTIGVCAGIIGATAVAGGLLVARSPLGVEPGLFLAVGLGLMATVTGIGTLITTKRRST